MRVWAASAINNYCVHVNYYCLWKQLAGYEAVDRSLKTPVTTPSSTPSSSGTSSGESDPELRYISKYLEQVITNATPKCNTSAAKRVSGARVLTSAKCAAILEERAAKKKAEEQARKAEEAAKKWENKTKKRTTQVPDTGTQAKKRKTTSESVAATGT